VIPANLSTWPMAKIEDFAADEPRSITDGPFGSNLKTAHYTEQGPRVIRLQNIGDGRFIDERAHISDEHYDKLKAHSVEAGDVVIASLGNDLPRACTVPSWLGPAIVKADCIRLRPAEDVDGRYVMYMLNAPQSRDAVKDMVHGVGRPRLGLRVIRNIEIPRAPLDEQQRIVEAVEEQFSRLDAGVGSLRRAKRNLAGLRAAILRATFEGIPTAPLADRLREPLRNGRSAKRSAGGGVRVLTLSAVTGGDFSESNTKLVDLVPDDVADLWLEPGDILIERSNTSELVGTAALYRGEPGWAIFPDLLIRVRVNDEIDARFLELCLQSPPLRQYFRSRAKGISGSMPKIDQATVADAPVPSVPLQEQLAIVAAADRQLSIVRAVQASIESGLAHSVWLRRAILRDAFGGRLAVRTK